MTASEKAKELYDKHYAVSRVKLIAKNGAMITVNEILNEPKMLYCGGGMSDVHYQHWEEVKNELEKL